MAEELEREDRTFFGSLGRAELVDEDPELSKPAPPAQGEASQRREIFRAAAIRELINSNRSGNVISIVRPWAGLSILIWTAFLGAALALSCIFKVEVVSRGRGVIRPDGNTRLVLATSSGTVTSLPKFVGTNVQEGDILVETVETATGAQMLEAKDRLEALTTTDAKRRALKGGNLKLQQAQLDQRLSVSKQRIRSLEGSVAIQLKKLGQMQTLFNAGLVSASTVDDAKESHAAAERALAGEKAAHAGIVQERSTLTTQAGEETLQNETERRQAATRVGSIDEIRKDALFRSPVDGVLDSLTVKVGDYVRVGQVVGRVVPVGTRMVATAFLPEKDRGFVRVGDKVALEVDQFPYAEFGVGHGRVLRVAEEVAIQDEVTSLMGVEVVKGPTVRVDLELGNLPKGAAPRPGMLLQARFVLRRQRPITMVLAPLEKWFR